MPQRRRLLMNLAIGAALPACALQPEHESFRGEGRVTEILLFHHAAGRTPGFLAFADTLRRPGHTVHTPDLFAGRVFGRLEDGLAHTQRVGFEEIAERGLRTAQSLPNSLVYAGVSMGVMPAQKLAMTRPGARAALLLEACIPLQYLGGAWPAELPVQIHGMDRDPVFAGEGDLAAAQELVKATPRAELFLYPVIATCSSTRAYRRTTQRQRRS
jgi:dienelactone hydrolase